jgi:hypothetical protein
VLPLFYILVAIIVDMHTSKPFETITATFDRGLNHLLIISPHNPIATIQSWAVLACLARDLAIR